MLHHRRRAVLVLGAAFSLALMLVLSGASSAVPSNPHEPNLNAPQPIEVSFIEQDFCAFPVLFEQSGKVKVIRLHDGRIIGLEPGSNTTLTNLEEPQNQITVHNTAALHLTRLPNDDGTLVVITGQILLLVRAEQVENLQQGIYLSIGRTTYQEDTQHRIIGPLTNQGQLLDVCAILD